MESSPEKADLSRIENAEASKLDTTQHIANGEVLLIAPDKHVRQIPVPTTDPNDPLNWARWRKFGLIANCCWFAIFSLLCVSGVGTFMETLYEMYMPAHNASEITGLSTYSSMVMAFGSFGMLPLAIVVGRRPVFLFSVTVAFIASITAGTSQTFDSHLISRIFLGLATGATESLLPLIISDATFLSERAFYFGLYWSVQNSVNAGLQIALSYLVAAMGWRWYYWLFAITIGFSIPMAVLFLPETRFNRPAALIDGHVVYTDEFGATHFLTDQEAREILSEGGNEQLGDATADPSRAHQKRSLLQELKPWGKIAENPLKLLLGAYGKIFSSLLSPGVVFSMLAASLSLGIGIAMTLIYSTILQEEYGWSAASVGLFNVGIIPAAFLAMVYSGWFADKMNLWYASRNGGIHKPEHHLLHLIVPYVTGAIGIIVFAICADQPQNHSAAGLCIAWGIYEFSFTAIIITTTTFAAEVIPDNPGAAMVPVVGGKNIISFGASYGLILMESRFNYIQSFMILLGIYTGIFALGIPVYFWNGKVRQRLGGKKNPPVVSM